MHSWTTPCKIAIFVRSLQLTDTESTAESCNPFSWRGSYKIEQSPSKIVDKYHRPPKKCQKRIASHSFANTLTVTPKPYICCLVCPFPRSRSSYAVLAFLLFLIFSFLLVSQAWYTPSHWGLKIKVSIFTWSRSPGLMLVTWDAEYSHHTRSSVYNLPQSVSSNDSFRSTLQRLSVEFGVTYLVALHCSENTKYNRLERRSPCYEAFDQEKMADWSSAPKSWASCVPSLWLALRTSSQSQKFTQSQLLPLQPKKRDIA